MKYWLVVLMILLVACGEQGEAPTFDTQAAYPAWTGAAAQYRAEGETDYLPLTSDTVLVAGANYDIEVEDAVHNGVRASEVRNYHWSSADPIWRPSSVVERKKPFSFFGSVNSTGWDTFDVGEHKLVWRSTFSNSDTPFDLKINIRAESANVDPNPENLDVHAARSADGLVEALCIAGHTNYNQYQSRWDWLEPLIVDSGVRCFRQAGMNKAGRLLLNGLVNDRNIKHLIVADPNTYPTFSAVGTYVQNNYGGDWSKVRAVAGVNEPNLFPPSGVAANKSGDPGTVLPVMRDGQAELRSVVPSGVDLLGPSWAGGGSESWYDSALSKTGSYCSDVTHANWHWYVSWRNPETSGWGSNGYGSLGWGTDELAARQCPSKGLATDEGGYSTRGQDWVPVSIQRKYIPRAWMLMYSQGYDITTFYEWVDQSTRDNREAAFGFIKSNGSPKPVYYTVQNTIDIVEEPGCTTASDEAYYTISSPNNFRHSSLTQCDGDTFVALWRGGKSWTGGAYRDVGTAQVTVDVPDGSTVRLFDPTQGTAPVQTWANADEVTITVDDEIQYLQY